jgi:hypothetical protein
MSDKRTIFILDKVDRYKNLVLPIDNPFKKFQQTNKFLKAFEVTKSLLIGAVFISTIIRLSKTPDYLEKIVEIVLILVAMAILKIIKPMIV